MKIEKVNENQIRCTLTKQDLAERQINIRELAYGSDKAKGLFHDMLQQANYEFGFDANDIPIMVEAIPLSSESLVLVITKVEYPEELDTRFSKFSDPGEDYVIDDTLSTASLEESKGADDILDIFRKIEEAKSRDAKEQADVKEGEVSLKPQLPPDLTKMFEFSDMSEIERVARVLNGYYDGKNDLYKNEKKNTFCLMIHKSEHTPEEYNKVCNMISEYGVQKNYTSAVGAFYAEHGKTILQDNALQVIATL